MTTACHKVLETGSKPTEEKKCEKYTERLGHILAGDYKKIPNTFSNQLKIALEVSKDDQLKEIIFSVARLEEHKANHKIIVALISLQADPNPIAQALQPDSDEIVDTFLDEFESSANRSEMVAILEAMMTQPEFAPSFFRIKTWD